MSFPYVCTVSIQYDETMGAAAAGERSRGFTTGLRDLLWAPPGNETGAGQAGVGPVSLSLSLSLSQGGEYGDCCLLANGNDSLVSSVGVFCPTSANRRKRSSEWGRQLREAIGRPPCC